MKHTFNDITKEHTLTFNDEHEAPLVCAAFSAIAVGRANSALIALASGTVREDEQLREIFNKLVETITVPELKTAMLMVCEIALIGRRNDRFSFTE